MTTKPTLRVSCDFCTDVIAWTRWYASMSGRSIISIVDEAVREWYAKHKDDFGHGPTITSAALEEERGSRTARPKRRDA